MTANQPKGKKAAERVPRPCVSAALESGAFVVRGQDRGECWRADVWLRAMFSVHW